MRRESLNGLGELTGIDRRTIKRKISHLKYEKDGRSHFYNSEEALPVIYSRDSGIYNTDQERARLTHHQANIAALDEKIKEKTLIPAEVVADRWQQIFANIRARLLSLPSSMAATCANQGRDDIEEKASDLIRQALSELSADVSY